MLAPQLQELISAAKSADDKLSAQRAMLDARLDLHNELTDWVANTDHGDAAAEVLEILERNVQGQPVSA